MPLEELTLVLDPATMPERVSDLIDESDRRATEFFASGRGRRFPRYIPSDPTVIHAAIAYLQQADLLRGDVFCEWGCGFGVATGIASLLGFRAYGIELEPDLVDIAIQLAEDLELDLTILNHSYFPEGFEEIEGVGGKDLLTPEAISTRGSVRHIPSYDELDPDEVDLFFVYPWPGEERLMLDLFTALSSPGAILLMYMGEGEIAAHLHDEGEFDDD